MSPVSGDRPRTRRTLHEAAHKLEVKAGEDIAARVPNGRPAQKRIFNEAAHKLGYWAPPTPDSREIESEAARKRFDALADYDRDVIAHAGRAVLVLGALGIVYGDIGTSPLYTEQVIFGSYHATAHVTPAVAYGIVSLIFWALTIVVSIKYAGFIMRAHNRGDGGIMALCALLHRNRVVHAGALVMLGIFGAALFFGDGIITPAISTSATSPSATATTTRSTSPARCTSAASRGCWNATSTSSTAPTSCRASPSPPPRRARSAPGARGSSSRWPGTRQVPSTTSDCRATAPS